MKMVFILVPYAHRVIDTISIPLGLATLNAIINLEIPELEIRNFDLLLEPEEENNLYQYICENKVDYIGIQAHSNVTINETLRIAQICKVKSPGTPIIIGGNAGTFMCEHLLMKNIADFIVLGEADVTIIELLKALIHNGSVKDIKGIAYNIAGKVIVNQPRECVKNLDDIPFPKRDAFNWHKYPQWSLMTSRGCPYSCVFCSASKFWGHKIRYRTAENVFEEIKELVKKYGVQRLYILDDTFGANKKETYSLLQRIIAENIKLEWACLTRADIVDTDMLDLFKRAGCVQVHFGLESAVTATQKRIKKNLDIDYLSDMVKHCCKIGLRTKLSAIFGLPEETENDVRYTIQYLLRIKPNEVQIYPLMPYVGTDAMNEAGIKLIEPDYSKWKQDALTPLTTSSQLTDQMVRALTEEAVAAFRSEGYKWIPMDLEPVKNDEHRIIKTVFAPIQGIKRN